MVPQLKHISNQEMIQVWKLLSINNNINNGVNQLYKRIEKEDGPEKIKLLYFLCQLQANQQEDLLAQISPEDIAISSCIENTKQLEASLLFNSYSELATITITINEQFNFDTLNDQTIQKLFANVENRLQKVLILNEDQEPVQVAIVMDAKTNQIYKTMTPTEEFFTEFINENQYFVIIQNAIEIQNINQIRLKYLSYTSIENSIKLSLEHPEFLQSVHLFSTIIQNLNKCTNLQNLSSDRSQYESKFFSQLNKLIRWQSIYDQFNDPKTSIEQVASQLEYLDIYYEDDSCPQDITILGQQLKYLSVSYIGYSCNQRVTVIVDQNDQQLQYIYVNNGILNIQHQNMQIQNISTLTQLFQIEKIKKLEEQNKETKIFAVMKDVFQQQQLNIKEFLLYQLTKKYLYTESIMSYMYLNNIEHIITLTQQQVAKNYHIQSYEDVLEFVQLITNYFECKSVKQLQAIIDFSKVLDTFKIYIQFDDMFMFEDITDNLWNQILDLANDHLIQMFATNKAESIQFIVAKNVQNSNIITTTNISSQIIEQLTNENTYDIILITDQSFSNVGDIKLRNFLCSANELKVNIKYPSELKSVYLNNAEIINIGQCTNLTNISTYGCIYQKIINQLQNLMKFSSENDSYEINVANVIEQIMKNNKQLQYITFMNIENLVAQKVILQCELPSLKVFYLEYYDGENSKLPAINIESCKCNQLQFAFGYKASDNQLISLTDCTGKPLKQKYIK